MTTRRIKRTNSIPKLIREAAHLLSQHKVRNEEAAYLHEKACNARITTLAIFARGGLDQLRVRQERYGETYTIVLQRYRCCPSGLCEPGETIALRADELASLAEIAGRIARFEQRWIHRAQKVISEETRTK